MTELAHLRFADDVFAAVSVLQRVHPLQAREAREIFTDAPEGWYVVTMTIDQPREMYDIVGRATALLAPDFDTTLLTVDLRRDGEKFCATFFNLRGFAQTVH